MSAASSTRGHVLGPITGGAPRLEPQQFEVVRFGYPDGALPHVLLGLSVHTPLELPAAASPTLVVERDAVELLYTPRVAGATQLRSRGPERWLWRGIFPVPRELASDRDALFALRLFDELRLGLPAPVELDAVQMSAGDAPTRRARRWPYAVRRTALMFVVTAQLCLVPALRSPGALAASVASSPTSAESATPPRAGEPTPSSPEGPPSPPAGGSGEKPAEKQPSAPEQPSSPPAGPAAEPKPQTPAQPAGDGSRASTPPPPGAVSAPVSALQPSSPSRHPSSSAHAAPRAGRHSTRGASPTVSDSGRDSRSRRERAGARKHARAHEPGARKGRHRKDAHSQAHHRSAEPSHPAAAATGPQVPAAIAPGPEGAEVSPLLLRLPPGLEGLGADGPPAYLIPIYEQAGSRYHVPWGVLAAINQIETDYGRNLSVSSAGAVGWMQFMPETWSRWAVDADHDGQLNPYSPLDAIFTAARYLQASGAETNLAGAILAYNHAQWYVSEVLMRARMLEGNLTSTGSENGYALPLDAPYMETLGRTDDGVDIETAPDGALVYSITPGVVTAVASDPSGFGPDYPVIQATSGTLAGTDIYYGHVARALVAPGQHVRAGQPIAVMGHTGDAVSLGHGHIEIGFSTASGDPLNHHGAGAWTPAGEVMRSFLITLTDAFRAHAREARASAAHARAARAHAHAHTGEPRRRGFGA